MKSVARSVSFLIAVIVFVSPSFAFAGVTISSPGSYTSFSSNGFYFNNGNFQIGWGSGAGTNAFACGSNNICQVAVTILAIINSVLVPLLFAIAFLVFLFGVADAYIFSRGDPAKTERGHKLILWGIIGFVVMVSLWGLVNVVANTFGLAGYSAPPLPTSY